MTTSYGKKLNWQSRQIIYNLHSYFRERKHDPTSEEYQIDINVIHTTAEAIGLSQRTISKVVSQGRSLQNIDGKVQFETMETERKTIRRKRIPMDCFTEGLIRRRVLQAAIETKNHLSFNDIHRIINQEDILHSCQEYLRKLLLKIGFRRMTKKRILYESPVIIKQRLMYLSTVKKCRDEGRPIIYIDETYISLDQDKCTNWETHDEKNGVLHFSGKGQGIIVIHAGGHNGFLDGALLTIKTLNIRACDFNFGVFSKWVKEQLLPHLPCRCLVIMDNAEYHSQSNISMPTEAWKKDDIKMWLKDCNEKINEDLGKCDLLALVKKHENLQEIDSLLKDNRHELLRLPPHHQELNPLELIWRDVKQNACLKSCYDLNEAQIVLDEIFSNYPQEKWVNCCEYVVDKIESEYFQYNAVFEEILSNMPSSSFDDGLHNMEEDYD